MVTETCILMEVANDIVASQTATNFEVQDYITLLIPIISIIVTGFIAYYNAKKTKEITEMSLEATTKNLIIQLNQEEIKESLKELSKVVDTGHVKLIREVLDTDKGIYIPPSLKRKIEEHLNGNLDEHEKKVVLDLIRGYIYP